MALTVLTLGVVQADWAGYVPASLEEALSRAVVVDGADQTIESGNVKYVVEAVYTGRHRELPPERRALFQDWAQSLGHPPEYAELCAHEVEVHAGTGSVWLSLQNALLEPFAGEAADGSRLRLHIMYVGAVQADRVFMIGRFEVVQ